MKRSMLALGLVLLISISGWAGSPTPKGFLYKPDLGARGTADKNLYDAGLDRVDARLGKEIWLGDPGGSPGYDTLAHALTTIGSNQTILRLPAGTITIADDTAIPVNVTLKPERGTTFSIAANKTLTISGRLDAGRHQIFSGPGKVRFDKGAVQEVHPEWWGFSSTAADTVNTAAVQAAINSMQYTDIGYVGRVLITQNGNVLGPIIVTSTTTLEGMSIGYPVLHNTGVAGENLFTVKNTRDSDAVPYRVVFKNLGLTGNILSGNGIHCEGPYRFYLDSMTITGHGGIGVNTVSSSSPLKYQEVDIHNSQVTGNYGGGIKLGDGNGNIAKITSGSINYNGYFGIYVKGIYQFQIRDVELGGYYYGALIAEHQAVPIALNGGSLAIIEGCSFENNAGNGATAAKSIRTGWDAQSQIAGNSTTSCLIVRNCGFNVPTGAHDGALDCIYLDFAKNVTIEDNQFDRAVSNNYVINAVCIGNSIGAYSQLLLKNNRINAYPYDAINLLGGNLTGAQYTVIDGTPNITLCLASDILLANDLKAKMNAHAADATEHTTHIDATNFPVTTADASGTGPTGINSLITLTTSLLTAYAAHEADAALSSGWAFHKAQETASHALLSAAAPTNYTECHQRLMDLQVKFTAHDADTGAHAAYSLHAPIAAVAAKLSNSFRFHGLDDSDPVLGSQRPQYPCYDAFRIEANGKHSWGPGNVPTTVDMYMDPSNYNLRTTKKFCADGGIGVGNAADGDVTSTAKTKKIQVFDAAGNSLGYLQVYAGP